MDCHVIGNNVQGIFSDSHKYLNLEDESRNKTGMYSALQTR